MCICGACFLRICGCLRICMCVNVNVYICVWMWMRLRTKLEAYAHQEHNVPEMKTSVHIKNAINKGVDLFGRGAVHGDTF